MNRLFLLSAFLLMLFASTAVHGAAYTVNAADDANDGACNPAHCSLREAILAVNADGSGSVSFAIGSGPVTISPAGLLPDITGAATLDATTQPGYSGTPIVKVRATFKITGSDTTVRGFEIANTLFGVHIAPTAAASNIAVERNFIGIDPTSPVLVAVIVQPGAIALSNVRIGNGTPAGRNVLAGNQAGIQILNGEVTVAGNYIRLADDGVTVLPFNMTGIQISGGTVLVGGSTAGARNVVSGTFGMNVSGGTVTIAGNYVGTNAAGTASVSSPTSTGIFVVNATGTSILRNVVTGGIRPVRLSNATGTIIRGNFIGTDATGNIALAGSDNGIAGASTGAVIGGSSPADRNVIESAGVRVSLGGSNNTVAGNFIGVTASGAAFNTPLAGAGIAISGGGTGNVIGGSAPGAGNVIAGNTVTTSAGGGINLETPDPVTVLGNFIGTNANGTIAVGSNAGWGIRVNQGSHVIGGAGANEGNTIVGTTTTAPGVDGYGIAVYNDGGATIRGNRIGTNVAGTGVLGNANGGIFLDTTGTNTIGGSAAGEGNVLAGNTTEIDIRGDSAVTIQGNRIGTNTAGSADITHSVIGIHVNAQAASTKPILIGGSAAGEGNLISGIDGDAIVAISNGGALTIRGNRIGTDGAGTAAIPNGRAVKIERNNAVIENNVIAYNTQRGVYVNSGTGNRINANSIHSNGSLGIDLNTNGVTPNDAGDGDSGANNLQNYPVLASALVTGGSTTVSGSLVSSPNTSFLVEVFSNVAGDPSGFGEGQVLIGNTTLTTNAGGNATFNLTLAAVTPGSVISATATNQTTNDTSEFSANVVAGSPGTFQFSSATYAVTEAGPSVTLTVTRTGGSVPASVDYTSTNGTAVAGNDFAAAGGTLNFAAADTSKTIVIAITNDALDEDDETFSVTLSNAGGATIGAPSTAVVTINDNDASPSLSIAAANVTEGNSGTTTLTFNVGLSTASGRQVTVDYTTVDQTASAGSDYGARFGTLTFAPGEVLQTVTVTVNGDTMAEANETLRVLLSNASNATLTDAEGSGTIDNDDGPPSISIGDVTAIEGNSGTSSATLTVALTNPSSSIVTADWATNGNTATSGSDFASGSGTVTFNPGDTSETITVSINGDTSVEGNENLFVDLTNAANGAIADAQATVTIADDDGTPSLTISNIAVDENAGTATLTVLLAPASAQVVTVNTSTSAGTASAGTDYTTTNTVLTFAAGDTSENIIVPIVNDFVAEGAETFSVALDTPVNASIANGTATVTIVDDDSTPQLTITDANVIEGDAGTTPAAFTVSLSHASASTITVNWTTNAGSATAGTDFASAGGSLTFLPGETSKPVTVNVNGDTSDEADETFFVALSPPANATFAKAQGTATIADDDGTPSLVIGDATLIEGNSGSSALVFTVTLAGSTAHTVTVGYATADGTATAGSDYAATSGTLTFSSGTTTQQVHVAVIGDAAVESDETLFLNLSGASNATISDNQATGTIANDDTAAPVPSISVGDMTLAEGNGGTANATFTVTLSVATTNAVSVQYATVNGSATAGSDYAGASGTVHFAPGATSQTVTVAVAGDTSVEPDETFTLDLSNPTNATLADGQGNGVIVNDDSPAVVPSISIGDATVTEGDSGASSATFAVTLSVATTNTVTVSYTTANGSATAGSDYAAAGGTVVFAAGVTMQNITIAVAGDLSVEPDETFTVALSNPTNATTADSQGAGLIVNDDSPAAVPTIAIHNTAVDEGDSGTVTATFNVTLTASTTNTVTVDYATANGSATAGSDYAATSGTLVFAPGVTSRTISVAVAGDTAAEANETFSVQLSNPGNATFANSQALGTINDDDAATSTPSITVSDDNVNEGNSGTGQATFTVRLSAPTATTVTCDYATSDGSATAGSDYASSTGSVVFAPGTTTQTISVAIAGDETVEPNETFFVTLSSPVNATIADSSGKGTIANDDFPAVQPTVTISDAAIVEGDTGFRTLQFMVTLSTATSIVVSAEYETIDVTAVTGTDYGAARGSLLFQPGVTSQTIDVPIHGDTEIESDETFRLLLRTVTGAAGSGSDATATIRDDDSGRPAAFLPIAGSGAGAGGAFFRTTLQFHNPTEHAMTGNLVIRSIGGGEPRIAPYAVQPHETHDVSAAFGAGFVTVDIAPLTGGLPEAMARVFNDGAERGTAGLSTTLASIADAITAGRRGVLLAPADGAAMRLNIGLRSLDEGVDATFALRRASGLVVESIPRTLAPNVLMHQSAATLFSVPLEPNDSIEVSVRTGSAIAYGSAVDNISQDPSFVTARPLP
ncbi:MAG TPA: Calx-beta domain-containing protein [Thermoanaerobaculia bacterium]|nr:Calx-beta domain-containing protein [Thermoanaerobaculia bacterium]